MPVFSNKVVDTMGAGDAYFVITSLFASCNFEIDEIIFYVSPEKLGNQAEYFYNGRKKINFFDNKQFDIVEKIQVGKDKKIVLRKK